MFKVIYIDDAGGTVEEVVLHYHHNKKTHSFIFTKPDLTTLSVKTVMVTKITKIEEEK